MSFDYDAYYQQAEQRRDALEAEIERLKQELEFAEALIVTWHGTADKALEENKRLREGLEKARDTFTDFAITLKTLGHPHMATAAQIAEEATQRILKGEKE